MARGKSFGSGFKSFEAALKNVKGVPPAATPPESMGHVLRGAAPAQRAQKAIDSPAASKPETKEVDAKTGLEVGDQLLFQSIVTFTKIRIGTDSYWRIRDLVRDSHVGDVSFNIDRYLGHYLKHPGGEENFGVFRDAVSIVERRGFISECKEWLKSTTPEGMRFGKGTRELRIDQARAFAAKAKMELEKVAAEMRIKI